MIQKLLKPVYFAPTARRHFFTRKAAANREADFVPVAEAKAACDAHHAARYREMQGVS